MWTILSQRCLEIGRSLSLRAEETHSIHPSFQHNCLSPHKKNSTAIGRTIVLSKTAPEYDSYVLCFAAFSNFLLTRAGVLRAEPQTSEDTINAGFSSFRSSPKPREPAHRCERIKGALLLRRPAPLETSHDGVERSLRHEGESVFLQPSTTERRENMLPLGVEDDILPLLTRLQYATYHARTLSVSCPHRPPLLAPMASMPKKEIES